MTRTLFAAMTVVIGYGLHVGIVSADPEGRSRPCIGTIDASGQCQPNPPAPNPPVPKQPATPEAQKQGTP